MERVSVSVYKDNFILKGGMLVSSLLGVDLRTTMDIDTTINALPLTESDVLKIIREICGIELGDNVSFKLTGTETIMEDFDYPGVRIKIEAMLDRMKQPLKIDISTDDVITPRAIEYKYRLLFEDRSIMLNTYNIETTLAEKSQTILSRGLANTRMRDIYDVYELVNNLEFSWELARKAFMATCQKRGTPFSKNKIAEELDIISASSDMATAWSMFRDKNHYVGDLDYKTVIIDVCKSISLIAG